MDARVGTRSRTVTYVTPPRLASLPAEVGQLEYSSRSLVFTRDGAQLLRGWGGPTASFVVGVEEAGDRWRVCAWGADGPTARAAVRALFSFAHPLESFYRLVAREPILAGTERRFRGLRLPRDESLFESLVHSIVGQQLSVAAATTIKRRLVAATGAYLDADGVEVARSPRPAELRALGAAGLASTGLSRAKSTALLALSDAADAGRFAPARWRRVPSDVAVTRLLGERGVGRWTAENALVRGAGRRDLFIAGDLGVRVALDRFGVVPRTAAEADARQWAATRYPGWGSYATLYLWQRLVADARAPPSAG